MKDYSSSGDDGLQTIDEDGRVPHTRMESAQDVSARVTQLLSSERNGRSQRRAMVKGLVDGNPPYKPVDMRKAGRAQACNVNWRVAEYYLNMARYAFYDVFSESPTFPTVTTDFGTPSQRSKWSRIITEEFDYLIRQDKRWPRVNQYSIYDMVLYGCGPLVFEDDIDWRNDFVQCANLVVPDFAPSEPEDWEEAVVIRQYLPHELYQFIRNEKAAHRMGWNIEGTKKAIMSAHRKHGEGGQYRSWEWHQQQCKNRSFSYSSECKTIQGAHYYYKEFPNPGERDGRVTHTLIVNPDDSQTESSDYLFRAIGRYESWAQIVHPMYYDNDGGGFHHSVTGLGQKMYEAMEYQNRLLCNACDKAFAPKLFFKTLNANSSEQVSLVQFGEYGQLPSNVDVVQTPVQSFLDEVIGLNREITGMLASNLSQYRSNLSKEQGNPITAYEASVRVAEQSRLGKTQLDHFCGQHDALVAEKYRRAVNPKLTGFMPGGREAKAFQNACLERGVPMEALRKVESVKLTRIAGQGSQFMRQQVLQELIAISPMIPSEQGRIHVLDDYIASKAGQVMVDRYNPKGQGSPEIADQVAIATLQVAAAREGIAPIVGGSQNHLIFCQVFLKAATEAVGSLNQGGDPQMVLVFLTVILPAIAQHLGYMRQDPTRQKEVEAIEEELKQLAQVQKQLAAQLQRMAEQQQQQAQRQQQVMNDAQLDQYALNAKLQQAQQKTDAGIQMKREKQNQGLALADAQTATNIRLNTAKTEAAIELSKQKAASSSNGAEK